MTNREFLTALGFVILSTSAVTLVLLLLGAVSCPL